jgi:hypothetical protein
MERTITITEKRFKEICAEVCAETTMSFEDKLKGVGILAFGLTASLISSKIGERLFPEESEAPNEFMSAMNKVKVKGEMENDF